MRYSKEDVLSNGFVDPWAAWHNGVEAGSGVVRSPCQVDCFLYGCSEIEERTDGMVLLAVGGPIDGHEVHVPEDCKKWQVPYLVTPRTEMTELTWETHTYERNGGFLVYQGRNDPVV